VRTRRGFTLIELLIVVAIIAILAAIALPNFLEAQTRSKVARVHADLKSLATAVECYAVDNNVYPLDADDYPLPIDFLRYNQARQMSLLTTPIAYVSGAIYDPFHLHNPPSPAMSMLFPGPPPYTYAYLTTGCYKKPYPQYAQPENNGRPQEYGLVSVGPNGDFDSAANQGINDTYDPTNGTVSRGDIMRYGPGGPSKRFP